MGRNHWDNRDIDRSSCVEQNKKCLKARQRAASHLFHGVSPWREIVPFTSPRLPSYETTGGHESRALQVAFCRASGLIINAVSGFDT